MDLNCCFINRKIKKGHAGLLVGSLMLGFAVSCGGGGGTPGTSGAGTASVPSTANVNGDRTTAPVIATGKGVFLDSAVAGIEYKSGSQEGVTDEHGTFTYERGATVVFKIGDIVLGEVVPADVITPVDLVPGAKDETHPQVSNILQLLQSLDKDANAENGITIAPAVLEVAKNRADISQVVLPADFTKNVDAAMDLRAFVVQAGFNLKDAEEVREHFHRTLALLQAGKLTEAGRVGQDASGADVKPGDVGATIDGGPGVRPPVGPHIDGGPTGGATIDGGPGVRSPVGPHIDGGPTGGQPPVNVKPVVGSDSVAEPEAGAVPWASASVTSAEGTTDQK